MKGNKGITLIALVITIIVLLILAGVSIAMLSGDNSILKNASKSADYNKIGEVKDEIGLRVSEYVMAYLDHTYNNTAYTDTQSAVLAPQSGAPTNAKEAAVAAVKSYTAPSGGASIKLYASDAGIAVSSGNYYDIGRIDATKGSVKWDGIKEGAVPETMPNE